MPLGVLFPEVLCSTCQGHGAYLLLLEVQKYGVTAQGCPQPAVPGASRGAQGPSSSLCQASGRDCRLPRLQRKEGGGSGMNRGH